MWRPVARASTVSRVFTATRARYCRNILIALIDAKKGEQTAQACANAWLHQVSVDRSRQAGVLSATAASHTPPWLLSGWECRGLRLSREGAKIHPRLLPFCQQSGDYRLVARIEMPSTVTSTVCALISHWGPISLGPVLAANSLCPW